jgi:hypothetical protein
MHIGELGVPGAARLKMLDVVGQQILLDAESIYRRLETARLPFGRDLHTELFVADRALAQMVLFYADLYRYLDDKAAVRRIIPSASNRARSVLPLNRALRFAARRCQFRARKGWWHW